MLVINCAKRRSFSRSNRINIRIKPSILVLTLITFAWGKVAFANEQSQIRSFDERGLPKQASYTIPPVSEREVIEDSNNKIALSNIVVVVKSSDVNGSLLEQEVTDPDVLNIISNELSNKNSQFTVAELQSLADQISAKYRESGILLSSAYIPAQEVKNGRLVIEVLQGVLSNVSVTGETNYERNLFSQLFVELQNKVVEKESAESALLLLQNRVPGAVIFGVFEPGSDVGLSDLNVNIAQEKKTDFILFADNYGSEFTGELRAGLHADIYNVTGNNDNLAFDIVLNEKPNGVDDNSAICCYGGVNYKYVGENLKTSVGVSYTKSTYDVGNSENLQLAALGLSGESQKLRLFGDYVLRLDRTYKLVLDYGVSRTEAESSVEVSGQQQNSPDSELVISRDDLAEYDVGLEFNYFGDSVIYGDVTAIYRVKPNAGNILTFAPKLLGYDDDVNQADNNGVFTPPTRVGTDQDATTRLAFNLNYIKTLSKTKFKYLVRLKGQISGDPLAPIQQFGLAGPKAVRAYETGAYLADEGLVASFELSATERLNDWNITPLIFVDYGYGKTNAVEGDTSIQRSAIALGSGLGLDASYQQNLNFSLSAAWEIREQEQGDLLFVDDSQGKNFQFYGSVVYRF